VPIAVIALEFDPFLHVGGWGIRLETLGLALAIVSAVVVAALVARLTPADPGSANGAPGGATLGPADVLYVVLAAIPGALVGGRLGYGLVHLVYYMAQPAALLDPGRGSLELSLGVVGAAVTGGYAARLLTGSAGPWFHAAAFPTLLLIGAGKVALALGGAGQGVPSDAAWATSYIGPGPWGSLAPDVASHPAQLFEAAGTGLVAIALVRLSIVGWFRVPDGRAWLVAVGGWALVRAISASTWRDPEVLGPLRAEQLLAVALAAGCAAIAIALDRPSASRGAGAGGVSWPDPDTSSRDATNRLLHGRQERT